MDFTAILRGAFGILALLAVAFLLSNNRKKINWRLVFSGILMQVVLAILILKVDFVRVVFDYIVFQYQGRAID